MHQRMTITLDQEVYEGLYRTIGKRRMSQFIEDLLRPHVLDSNLDEGYRAMAADSEREKEASEWSNGLAGEMADKARLKGRLDTVARPEMVAVEDAMCVHLGLPR
jgi:predicted CopG family antitoxin